MSTSAAKHAVPCSVKLDVLGRTGLGRRRVETAGAAECGLASASGVVGERVKRTTLGVTGLSRI